MSRWIRGRVCPQDRGGVSPSAVPAGRRAVSWREKIRATPLSEGR